MTARWIYVVTGEPSGDFVAARVMAGLRALAKGDVAFAGVGGESMRAEGLTSLFPLADLAVMGLAEVVPRIPRILRRLDQVVADIVARKPAAIVTVDSWGFNRRLHDRLKAAGVAAPRIHCVAPMVWAWKAKRVHELKGRVDLLLCLLPNEPPLFEAAGVRAIHMGHPVLESGADKGDGSAFRARHAIPSDVPLLCVLPGSRATEVARHLPVFGETLGLLKVSHPNLRAAVPTVETVGAQVEAAIRTWPVPSIAVHGAAERYDAFAASRVALAASGTVALELTMAGLPTVVGYRLNPITGFIARRLVKLDYVSMPNLLAGRGVVPEFLLDDCRPERLAPALLKLLDDEAARAHQRAGFDEAMAKLGRGGEAPSHRAARAILDLVAQRSYTQA